MEFINRMFESIKNGFKPKEYTTGWKKVFSKDGKAKRYGVHNESREKLYDVFDESDNPPDSIFDVVNMRCRCGASLTLGRWLGQQTAYNLAKQFLEAHKGHVKEKVQ